AFLPKSLDLPGPDQKCGEDDRLSQDEDLPFRLENAKDAKETKHAPTWRSARVLRPIRVFRVLNNSRPLNNSPPRTRSQPSIRPLSGSGALLTRPNHDEPRPSGPTHPQQDVAPGGFPQGRIELAGIRDRLAVDPLDHIAALQAGIRRAAVRV